jgi:hypothetical protein
MSTLEDKGKVPLYDPDTGDLVGRYLVLLLRCGGYSQLVRVSEALEGEPALLQTWLGAKARRLDERVTP